MNSTHLALVALMRDRSGALQHSQQVILSLFGPVNERSFDVRYWDGSVEETGRPSTFALAINRPGALRRMLLPPSELSIGEAFLAGDVDVDGDLEQAVGLADEINTRLKSLRTLLTITRHLLALPTDDVTGAGATVARTPETVRRAGRRHEPVRDRAAIRYHYDVGNDFYAIWLDERMVYSCAYFHSPNDSLEDAQLAKLDLVCRKLRLTRGERFLDVGCGWGALVMHAAAKYGALAYGITLSDQQVSLANRRIAEAGLSERCQVEIRDYRDIPRDMSFDKIASVGMVEHVGVDQLPTYFESLHDALVPGGLLLNHGIVHAGERAVGWRDHLEHRVWRRDAFIDQYVFPDGKLGPLDAVIAAAESVGFETRDVESLREHYVLTLREWLRRLNADRDPAIALTNDRVYRTWRLYMSASAHGFSTARLNVVQSLFAKPDANGRSALPLTRSDIIV